MEQKGKWGNRVIEVTTAHLNGTLDYVKDRMKFDTDEQATIFAIVCTVMQMDGYNKDDAMKYANIVARTNQSEFDDIYNRVNII